MNAPANNRLSAKAPNPYKTLTDAQRKELKRLADDQDKRRFTGEPPPGLIPPSTVWVNTQRDGFVNHKGNRCIAANVGARGVATVESGVYSVAVSTGAGSVAANNEGSSVAVNTGTDGGARTEADGALSIATGDNGLAGTDGVYSMAISAGEGGTAKTKGHFSTACNFGVHGGALASSYSSVAFSHAPDSSAVSTGHNGVSIVLGSRSAAECRGTRAIACAIGAPCGRPARAKAAEGGAIVLASYTPRGQIAHIRVGKVGGNGILPNVWYELDAEGEFVEAKNQAWVPL